MIYNQKFTSIGDRTDVLQLLSELKSNKPDFTLIDIGASANPWTRDFVTHIVDIESSPLLVKSFKGNISDYEVWEQVLEYVKQHGKFDYASCTHTLEDISAAKLVCTMISKISNQGFVAVPSKFAELSNLESEQWMGYIHHRWIYDTKDGKFIGYPKQSFLENFKEFKDWSKNNPREGKDELQFFWKDDFALDVINNDHLGPNIDAVINYYRRLI